VTLAPASDRTPVIFGLLLAAGAVAIVAAGLAPQSQFPGDVAAYLDICYQSIRSLRLGRDFFSPIGPGAVLPTVLAMRAGLPSARALVAGSALAWLGYGCAAWWVARPRMSAAIAAGFALFAAGTAAAPYALDFGRWRILSYAMVYNRFAWAAVAIAACGILAPRAGYRPNSGGGAGGFGGCAAWLWTIKPNYLLILAPLALVSVCHAGLRRSPIWVGWFLAGALATGTVVWLGVPFDPMGYVREHLQMGEAAPVGLLVASLQRALRENLLPVAVLIAGWLIAVVARRPAGAGRSAAGNFAIVLGLIAAGFIANMVNCQFAEIPLWGALGWILAASLTAASRRPGAARGGVAIGLALGIAYTWQPLAAIAYTLAWKRLPSAHAQPAAQVASPAWAGLPMRFEATGPALAAREAADGAVLSPGDFADWLNDGLRLVNQVRPAGGAILCLDWINPFRFALASPPIEGDLAAWSIGWHADAAHLPDAGRLLAQVAVVMEPKHSIQPVSLAVKRALFAAGLKRDFVLAGENPNWRAWVRSPAAAAAVNRAGRLSALYP
jgi:hypothetical protein